MKATKDIIKQIDDMFGDTSVSQRTTLKALEEIRDELDSTISALRSARPMARRLRGANHPDVESR